MFNPVAPYRYMFPIVHLSVADIANPDMLACGCRTWIRLDIARFYGEQCHGSYIPGNEGSLYTQANTLKYGRLVVH